MGDADLKDKGVSFIAQAVKEDEAGNLQKAFNLYMTGLDYLSSHLKYEKNPKGTWGPERAGAAGADNARSRPRSRPRAIGQSATRSRGRWRST